MKWELLLQKQVAVEIIPEIKDSYDTQNFKSGAGEEFDLVVEEDDEGHDHELWASNF